MDQNKLFKIDIIFHWFITKKSRKGIYIDLMKVFKFDPLQLDAHWIGHDEYKYIQDSRKY